MKIRYIFLVVLSVAQIFAAQQRQDPRVDVRAIQQQMLRQEYPLLSNISLSGVPFFEVMNNIRKYPFVFKTRWPGGIAGEKDKRPDDIDLFAEAMDEAVRKVGQLIQTGALQLIAILSLHDELNKIYDRHFKKVGQTHYNNPFEISLDDISSIISGLGLVKVSSYLFTELPDFEHMKSFINVWTYGNKNLKGNALISLIKKIRRTKRNYLSESDRTALNYLQSFIEQNKGEISDEAYAFVKDQPIILAVPLGIGQIKINNIPFYQMWAQSHTKEKKSYAVMYLMRQFVENLKHNTNSTDDNLCEYIKDFKRFNYSLGITANVQQTFDGFINKYTIECQKREQAKKAEQELIRQKAAEQQQQAAMAD